MNLFSDVPQTSLDFPASLAERYRPRQIAEFIGLAKTVEFSSPELRPHRQRGFQQCSRSHAEIGDRNHAGSGVSMRTRIAHILPGCVYCNFDHDPANECRFQPESTRFQLTERSIHMEHQHEEFSPDVCIAGESARNGVCGDPECVCAPSPPSPPGPGVTVKTLCNRPQNVSRLQYVAKHSHVLYGTSNVAVARSHTFAKRIAKALNQLQEREP